MSNVEFGYEAHFLIQGERFKSAHDVFMCARRRGFAGTVGCLISRLRNGPHTWAALLAPLQNRGQDARREQRVAKREAMHRMCEAIDARKRELAQ